MRRAVAILALLAGRARADDIHDTFGLGKPPAAKPPVRPDDIRDTFGLGKVDAPTCTDPHALGCVWPAEDLDAPSPYNLATWLPGSYLLALPVGDATHDQVAHYALGASRDETGPVFGSGNGLENRWTIEGAPADNAQFGGADTRVPLAFLDGLAVSAGGFSARDRASLGGTIDARLRRGTPHHELDVRVYGSLTGDVRHRPDTAATFQLRGVTGEVGPSETVSLVATGPLPAGAWYAAGFTGTWSRTDLTARSASLVDADGDMVPDLDGTARFVLAPIGSSSTTATSGFYAWMARAGWDDGPHHVDATLIGNLAQNSSFLQLATDQASGIDRSTWTGDAIATYRGEWHDTHVRAQLAWHRSIQHQHAHDPAAADQPALLSGYIPATIAEDQALADACVDAPMATFHRCPIPLGLFASGGAGLLVTTIADRPSLTAEVSHRIGHNVLRAGVTGEDTRLVLDSRFTGGEEIRSLFPGHVDELRFVGKDCGAGATDLCDYLGSQALTYRTRYAAAFVEDTFSPAPTVRVDGGLRWEMMEVGSRLDFATELAPRLGIAWDALAGYLGPGHSRVWVSMGRSFAMLPAGLGQTILAKSATVSDTDVTGIGSGRVIDRGAPILVVDGIQPLAQDELTAGIEVGSAQAVKATAWVQGRWIERGLDTTDHGFDNPGARGELPAQRGSGIFALELATQGNPAIRAGYQYGRAFGSWTGAYDPRQGAVLYAGDAYDTGSVNLYGRLPADQGHRVYVEGARTGKLYGFPVVAALRLTLASGRPRDIVALTSNGDVELVPRGSNGRGPMLSQANVRLGTRIEGVDVMLDVFNLFDRREATNLDQVYSRDSVDPVVGGEASDLIWLRNANGDPAKRSRTYGTGTAFQSPLSATLSVRRAF